MNSRVIRREFETRILPIRKNLREAFMTQVKNDLKHFQEKVFAEYKLIKSFDETPKRMNEKREKSGCLYSPFGTLADLFVSKILDRERRKRNFAGNEREAEELLGQKEIFERVCEMIANANRLEILTEEKFVNELTAALFRSDLEKQFIIPENAVLYAMMARKIFDAGLENFCGDRKTNE